MKTFDFSMQHDGGFQKVDGTELKQVLESVHRQYLVGNLKTPQELPHVQDEKIEIGITHYDTPTEEAPHWHPLQREYQYMLAGRTVYTDSISGETWEYQAGDFYGITPQVCYRQFSEAGTMILFIKHPAVNDKIVCKHCKHPNCPSRIEPFAEEKSIPTPP